MQFSHTNAMTDTATPTHTATIVLMPSIVACSVLNANVHSYHSPFPNTGSLTNTTQPLPRENPSHTAPLPTQLSFLHSPILNGSFDLASE